MVTRVGEVVNGQDEQAGAAHAALGGQSAGAAVELRGYAGRTGRGGVEPQDGYQPQHGLALAGLAGSGPAGGIQRGYGTLSPGPGAGAAGLSGDGAPGPARVG